MPFKRGDTRIQSGGFDQKILAYRVAEVQDDESSIVRTPSDPEDWQDWACKQPYLGQELRDATKTIGETWATFSVRYFMQTPYVEGMQIIHVATGEVWEIRGVEHIDTGRKKVELTCRMVR